jgi:hypothetical protein
VHQTSGYPQNSLRRGFFNGPLVGTSPISLKISIDCQSRAGTLEQKILAFEIWVRPMPGSGIFDPSRCLIGSFLQMHKYLGAMRHLPILRNMAGDNQNPKGRL